MPKPLPQRKSEIVMMVDRDTGVLDLRVFATHCKRGRAQIVGTATLRMEDLRELAPMADRTASIRSACKGSSYRKKEEGKPANQP